MAVQPPASSPSSDPRGGISSNATQLAQFYQMLVRGGELDGVRVMQSVTIMEARRPSSDGVIDAFIKRPVRWAQGFQLGGPSQDPRDLARVMGMTGSPDSFGHAGNASCVTWADPTRRLVLVYLSNIQPRIDKGIQHLSMTSDAVLSTFGNPTGTPAGHDRMHLFATVRAEQRSGRRVATQMVTEHSAIPAIRSVV